MILWEALFAAALLGAAVSVSAWAQWRGARGASAVLFGAAAPALFLSVLLLWAKSPDGRPYYQMMREEAGSFFQAQSEMLVKNGEVPQDRVEASRKFLEKFYVDLLPGWMASTCLLLGWFGASIAGRLLARLSSRVRPPDPFRLFAWPEPMVFGVIAAIGLLAAAPLLKDPQAWSVWGGSLLVLFGTAYFLMGLAVVSFFFWKWRLHPALRIALYTAVFLMPSSVVALALLGVLDLWMDFRKLKPAAPAEGKDA